MLSKTYKMRKKTIAEYSLFERTIYCCLSVVRFLVMVFDSIS